MNADTPQVRAPFARLMGFTLRTGILLLVVFGVLRVALVLQANVTGNYQAVSVIFVIMAVLPWIVLTRSGRQRIGLTKPTRARWLLPAAATGAALSLTVFALFTVVWGATGDNAFVYIGDSYSAVPSDVSSADRLIYFIIFAVIGMTFSPIGEELLYRGLAQESLAAALPVRSATLIESAAFALVHLAHFGVVYRDGVWQFLPLPAALWVVAMFLSALVFAAFRTLSGSILGAVLAHAGFNVAMTAVIFYGLDIF